MGKKAGEKLTAVNSILTDTNKKQTKDIAKTFACYFPDLYSSNDNPDIPHVDHIYIYIYPSQIISAEDDIKQLKTLKKRNFLKTK